MEGGGRKGEGREGGRGKGGRREGRKERGREKGRKERGREEDLPLYLIPTIENLIFATHECEAATKTKQFRTGILKSC